MSEPMPRPPATTHPTRQQLDELEALMQRMLALPVNQQAEETDLPALAADPGAEVAFAENADSPLPNTWEGSLPPVPTVATDAAPAPRAEVTPPPVVAHHPVVAPRLRRSLEVRPRPPRLRAAWLLAPVVWLNRAFDRCAARLGAPGRWLCSPAGRNVLGWLGVACLAAAAAWVIIELNWTW